MPRAGREGYRVAVVDIQSEKPAASPRRLTLSMAKVWRTASAPTPPARPASPPGHGVDEIFSRVDLLVYSAGIAKAAFISDFALGDFDRSLQVNLVGYFLCAREFSRLMIRDGIRGGSFRSTRIRQSRQ